MASSETEVVNIALTHLGADLIASLDDPSKSASRAKANFGMARDAVLRRYPWKCAKKWAVLTPENTTPINPNFAYQFILPPDFLRLISTDQHEYAIEGSRRILANTDALTIQYVYRNKTVAEWDDLLVQAIAARLAHLLAYPLVQSTAMRDAMWELYKTYTSEALTIDSQEGMAQDTSADEWLEARF